MEQKERVWQRIEGTQLSSDKPGQWHLVYVVDDNEAQICQQCDQHIVPFFLSVLSSDSGDDPSIAWPGYVFCKLTEETKAILQANSSVISMRPVADEISLINQLQRYRGAPRPTAKDLFQAGDPIKIHSGPFSGHNGILKTFRSGGKKARVEVSMYGRIHVVEIDSSSLVDRSVLTPEEISLATFRLNSEIKEQLSIAVTPINTELISFLSRHPELLYEVNPYRFEEIVAELLVDMGYSVHITPPSRDGGRDILAVLKIPIGEILTIVDCKRYSRSQRIGPDIVQRLLWIADHKDRASRAMIATTTFFTSGARDLEREYRWRLTLSDFNDVSAWLTQYGKWKRDEAFGLWIPKSMDNLRVTSE